MMNKEQFLSVLQNKKPPRNEAEINGLKVISLHLHAKRLGSLPKSLDIDKDEAFDATLKKQQFAQMTDHFYSITSMQKKRSKKKKALIWPKPQIVTQRID